MLQVLGSLQDSPSFLPLLLSRGSWEEREETLAWRAMTISTSSTVILLWVRLTRQ